MKARTEQRSNNMIDSRKRNRKEPYISEKKETSSEIVTDSY